MPGTEALEGNESHELSGRKSGDEHKVENETWATDGFRVSHEGGTIRGDELMLGNMQP